MKTFAELKATSGLRVGYIGKKRLVVYDPSIQPDNLELMLLYSVHGHALCLRNRSDDEPRLINDALPESWDFALEQYAKWCAMNAQVVPAKRSLVELDSLPPIRTKCPKCDGIGTWMDRVNKCSYGVIQEETNVVERCDFCHGNGFVEDFLE